MDEVLLEIESRGRDLHKITCTLTSFETVAVGGDDCVLDEA